MNRYICTALSLDKEIKVPIGSKVLLAYDSYHAYTQIQELFPQAQYWEVGLILK